MYLPRISPKTAMKQMAIERIIGGSRPHVGEIGGNDLQRGSLLGFCHSEWRISSAFSNQPFLGDIYGGIHCVKVNRSRGNDQ